MIAIRLFIKTLLTFAAVREGSMLPLRTLRLQTLLG
jgi:hypothetical protein